MLSTGHHTQVILQKLTNPQKIKYNQNNIWLSKCKIFFSPVNKFTSTGIAELLVFIPFANVGPEGTQSSPLLWTASLLTMDPSLTHYLALLDLWVTLYISLLYPWLWTVELLLVPALACVEDSPLAPALPVFAKDPCSYYFLVYVLIKVLFQLEIIDDS